MPGKALDQDQILALLQGSSASDKARQRNLKVNREGPLDVLIQPDYCRMCARENGPKTVKVMYTVNGEPLCSPHAMYVLSAICVDNGYKCEVAGKLPELSGQL